MNKIIITFLTEKGRKAYNEIEEEGKKQSWKNRRISNSVASDEVISENPFRVRINIKIARLAVMVKLDEQTKIALEKKGLKEGKDFTMLVT
jgi:hypothetical protein